MDEKMRKINIYVLFQYMCDSHGAQRSLPLPANPPYGALGQAGICSHPPPPSHHEEAAVPTR